MRFFGLLGAIHRVTWRMTARLPFMARRYCCICNKRVRRFLPYRRGLASVPPLMLHLNVIGSDVENFECPVCLSHDRERHLFLYLHATNLLNSMTGKCVLHFAPERHLQRFISLINPAKYILGDLYPTSTEVQTINLESIPYPNEYFDFILANHVLEHVTDDKKALQEIFRVLRPGGYAILQTPYSVDLFHTFEDPGITGEQACLQAYGQEDHRRLYGKDIACAIQEFGFRSLMQSHAEALPDIESMKFGVNSIEPFFLFQK